MTPRTRIAPTPSGFLHSGNEYSFSLTAAWAKELGAEILLRIDDLDDARKRPEYVANIFDTLHRMHIGWQLGPQTPREFEEKWSQRWRLNEYNAALEQLCKVNGLVYACTCSRKDLSQSGKQCECAQRQLPLHTPDAAWRVNVPAQTLISFHDEKRGAMEIDLHATAGNFVVRRRDGIAAYQIASLVDDKLFEITHIVRGEDLLPSTAAQLFLARHLGYESFLKTRFLHHELITDEQGNKLSKSNQTPPTEKN
ncbi:MAG: glutamate--tRNA ligase family protein [Bacteroidia bacterium]|jgi:glutamyl-tRNA synthetase|nr:glutamate--tRNA ligase family protein [Bacteroidia bacterium]